MSSTSDHARADVVGDLSTIDVSGRVATVRDRLAAAEIPGLLLTDPVSIRWLTGFAGSTASVVITGDALSLVTDGRYADRAREELDAAGCDADIVVALTATDHHDAVVRVAVGLPQVGAEASHLTHERWRTLRADLPITPADGIVTGLRRTKDPSEIERIAAAARCADAALAEVAPRLGEGLTEHDVRTELEYLMRRSGADGPAYDTIVASGPDHGARPHHEAARRRLVEGDTVIIDVGALVDGYRSDMTRSFVVGDPSSEQRDRYELVREMQAAGVAVVRAGVAAKSVDAACRTVADAAGFGDWFVHGTGHGVGLRIHEAPFLSRTTGDVLVAGDVVTVEPGLYRVGFGGFRVEDLLVVTTAGCRTLTSAPKDLHLPCPPSPPTT